MRSLIYILIVLGFTSVNAQSFYRFGQFNFAKNLYNPASIGSDASFTADLIYRDQWRGVEGSPKTAAFSTSYDIDNSMAVGLSFYNDRIGHNQVNSFSGMYAYRVIFSERNYLSLGIGLGGDHSSWNLADASTTQVNDPAFSQSYSSFKFNASFGVYYRNPKFYLGLSIPQILQNNNASNWIEPELNHYHGLIGYYFEINENMIIQPSLQMKIVRNTPIQADGIVRFLFSNFGAGIGYRTENSLIASLDYVFLDKLRVGYMFNYDVGKLSRAKGMSNEVYLGIGLPYYFNKDRGRKYLSKSGKFSSDYRRNSRRNRR